MDAPYAARYARALLDILEQENFPVTVEAAGSELDDFAAAWQLSPGLREVFLDPSISAAKKVDILDKLNGRLGMSRPIRNFLAVIVNHDRMEGLAQILDEFRSMVREDLQVAKVEWVTARPLGEEERRRIEARLAEMTGKQVEATFREDAAVLGGARLQIGSVVYDGTVRGRLDGLKERLAGRT